MPDANNAALTLPDPSKDGHVEGPNATGPNDEHEDVNQGDGGVGPGGGAQVDDASGGSWGGA